MNGTTGNTTAGQFISQLGLGIGSYITMSNVTSASPASYIEHFGSGDRMTIFQDGTGVGIYNEVIANFGVFNVLNSNTTGTINLMSIGGIGSYVDLNTFDGTGFYVNGVDDPVTPTTGGDVYSFFSDVYTTTPIAGNTVFGSVLGGNQYGVGHGIIINHAGSAGRNAAFNITNAANPNPAIFSVNEGTGSVIVGQNRNNTLPALLNVANFAYTGTQVNDHDHVGVRGYSLPNTG